MSSQPANTSIKVFRTVRAYRNQRRHESVEALIKKQRPLIMSIPGREILTGVVTRDTTLSDFSVYSEGGFPRVIGHKNDVTASYAIEHLPGIAMPTVIGNDLFITNSDDSLSRDLHSDLRALQS